MMVYLHRRPLLLFSVVHTSIPLRLPLRNIIRKSSIHRRSIVASVPLLPAKAREGAGGWLLLRPRCCTVAVVPLLPAKAREGAGGWLLLRRQRCTVSAVLPQLPAKAREGAGSWLLLRRQCCTVAAAVVSHKRFRTITMPTAVLRRRPRDTRRAYLCLVPGSSASLAQDSRGRTAVMWPQLL